RGTRRREPVTPSLGLRVSRGTPTREVAFSEAGFRAADTSAPRITVSSAEAPRVPPLSNRYGPAPNWWSDVFRRHDSSQRPVEAFRTRASARQGQLPSEKRRGRRISRPQRGGQVHGHADPDVLPVAQRGLGDGARLRRIRRSARRAALHRLPAPARAPL